MNKICLEKQKIFSIHSFQLFWDNFAAVAILEEMLHSTYKSVLKEKKLANQSVTISKLSFFVVYPNFANECIAE